MIGKLKTVHPSEGIFQIPGLIFSVPWQPLAALKTHTRLADLIRNVKFMRINLIQRLKNTDFK